MNGIGSLLAVADALETSITQLEASNTTAGTIEITELAAGVDIALGTVSNGTRDVIITAAAGAITDGNGAALNITAGTATLTARNGIGSADALETSINWVTATNTTAGNIQITESNGLEIVGSGVLNQGTGGGIAIDVLAGNLTINGNVTAFDGNVATTEAISLTTQAGTISIGNNVLISTDDDPMPSTPAVSHSDVASLDSLSIRAGALGNQMVSIGTGVVLRTDGGVANHFYDRVVPGGPGTSLFSWGGTPFLSTVSRSGTNYVVTFSLTVGVAGEENLRMDIDWRDPSDSRIESFYFTTPGPNVVSHIYSSNDFIEFITRNKPIFLADFSVSQHQSIQVLGGTLIQDGVTASKTSGPLSTTDLYAPDPSVHGPYGNPNLPGTNNPVTVVSDTDSNNDFHFEDGLVEIRVMTPPFPEIAPDPRPPAPAAAPADVPNLVVPFLVNVVPAEVVETPLSSFSTQSEDYFQLRKFDGETRIVVDEKYEHIDDDFGELLLLPSRLKQWVQVEELEDQTGLELWLITKKKTSEGDVIVERPVLKFDIAEGQPFPAKEPMPEIFEELKLVPMDIDGDANTQKPGTPGNSDGSPVPTDNPASGTNTEPNDGDDKTPAADGQSRFVPSHSGGGTLKSHPDYEETVSSTTSYSVLTSVAVGAVLNKSRTASMVPSKSRQMLNRILNRQR